MVPIEEYATVSQDATLYEAVAALEKAQAEHSKRAYKHRAILVYDDNKKVVGKLSQHDFLEALEPNYDNIGDMRSITRSGYSTEFIRKLMDNMGLWQNTLRAVCSIGAQIKVKDAMYTPSEGEYIREEASLREGMHLLVFGKHHSLLVTRDSEVVGVLRLTDVFCEVVNVMKNTCQSPS
jgi:CBS domain-containing protein